MSKTPDWPTLRQAWIIDPERPTLREFSQRLGLLLKTLQNRASKERWREQRKEYWEKVGNKTHQILTDSLAQNSAASATTLLEQIAEMRDRAIAKALVGDYDGSGEAVLAVERLTKLERLLLGESTENIKLHDMRAVILRLMDAIRRRFGNQAMLELADEFEVALGENLPEATAHSA